MVATAPVRKGVATPIGRPAIAFVAPRIGPWRQPGSTGVHPDEVHGPGSERTVLAMLWTILVILFVLWALGVIASVGGAAIHLLLVVAALVLLAQLVSGRRSTV
jgi:hypothetical protein